MHYSKSDKKIDYTAALVIILIILGRYPMIRLIEKEVTRGMRRECIKILERKDNEPFFLYLTISYPHPPYACEEPWYSSIDRNLIEPERQSALTLDKPTMLQGICKSAYRDVARRKLSRNEGYVFSNGI